MADALPLRHAMSFEYGVPGPMSPGVSRIVANNPSPFTFKGTNTYLIGSTELAVIDPGPDDEAHIDAILAAAGGRPITHVFITHTHRDHTDGLPRLLDRIKARDGTRTCGYGRTARNPGAKGISPSGTEFIDADFRPDIVVGHDDTVSGEGWTLRGLFTPGHAPDHLCFALEQTGVVFSGDHVMSWNTTVVAPPEGSMAEYMASLELLLARDDRLFLPGHGGRLEPPRRYLRAFIVHRQWREQAILGCIRDGTDTVGKIADIVYSGLDPRLLNAAKLSVLAHVEHLADRGMVTVGAGSGIFDRPICPV